MVDVNEPPYKKAACFHGLSETAYGLLDTYSPQTVMMFVSRNLPIATSMALTEASSISNAVKSSLFDIRYLDALSFIKRDWQAATTANSEDLSTREPGLYGVKFQCSLHGPSIDPRIINDREYSTDFVLLLPQHAYNIATSNITEIFSPERPTVGRQNTLFSTPARAQPSRRTESVSLFTQPPPAEEEKEDEERGSQPAPERTPPLGQQTPGTPLPVLLVG